MPHAQSNRMFGSVADALAFMASASSLLLNSIAGIIINLMLAKYAGIVAVGQFNLLCILYFIIGQGAALGVHLSCLHYQSLYKHTADAWHQSAQAACLMVAGSGLFFGGLLLWLAKPVAILLQAPALAPSLVWLAGATFFYGCNKVFCSLLNAADRIYSLAFLQGIRPIVWMGTMFFGMLHHIVTTEFMGLVLLCGEIAVFFFGLILLRTTWATITWTNKLLPLCAKHITFGLKAMPSHVVIELNAKIDVLILSAMTTDTVVGIYSFIALLAEGIFQGGVLVRTIINRRLVRTLAEANKTELQLLMKQTGRWNLGLTAAASAVLLLLYPHMVTLLNLDPSLLTGQVPLAIILVGILLSAYWAPFWMCLLLAGYPLAHTTMMLILCSINIIFNFLLIPFWGINGAATGTAMMFALFPCLLYWWLPRIWKKPTAYTGTQRS